MSLESHSSDIARRLAGFGHKVKFVTDEGDVLVIDATTSPASTSNQDEDTEVSLTASLQTFENILNGTQDANFAYMMGKLKVQGSLGLAIKLNSLLEN